MAQSDDMPSALHNSVESCTKNGTGRCETRSDDTNLFSRVR